MVEKWVFLNGAFCLETQAMLPVTDRGFLFGEGIFTTIRVDQGKCEFLQAHLQRLQQQAKALNFECHLGSLEWISELIQRNQAGEGIWRLKLIVTVKEEQATRGVGNFLATLHPYQEIASAPCTLCLFPHPLESPLAHVKSLAYLDHLYVRNFAQQQGHADAVTRTRDGLLLETGCSNLFWIDQGQCWIPDPALPYLKGMFLQALLPHLSLPVHFVKATLNQVPVTASVYICNSLTHVRPVLSIDQHVFPRNQQWEAALQKATLQAINKSFRACL